MNLGMNEISTYKIKTNYLWELENCKKSFETKLRFQGKHVKIHWGKISPNEKEIHAIVENAVPICACTLRKNPSGS